MRGCLRAAAADGTSALDSLILATCQYEIAPDTVCSNAAIDLNRSWSVLFVDQSNAMPHGMAVMLRIALIPMQAWNRESDCRPSYAHSQTFVKGLGS